MRFLIYYQASLILGCITALTSGFAVFLRNKKSLVTQTWLGTTFTSAMWSLGYFGMISSTTKLMAWWSNWFLHAFAVFIPAFHLHFVLALTGSKKERWSLISAYLISTILFFINPSHLFIRDVFPKFIFNYCCDAGPLYIIFALYFVLAVLYSWYILIRTIRKVKGLQSLQLKYFFLSSIFGFTGGGQVFFLTFNIPLPPVSIILFGLYPLVVWYAIVRYRLMDINVVVTRAAIFLIVYLIVLGLPFVIGYRLQDKGLWTIPLLVMAFFATAGPFIYTYLQHRAERRIRREEFLAHEALNKLAQHMMRFTDLQTLLKLIVHQVVKIMKVDSASIYLRDEENKDYQLRATWSMKNISPEQNEFLEESALLKDILLRRVPIVSEELRFGRTSKISAHLKRLQSELQKANAAVVVPAFKGDAPFGFLILGARCEGRLFSQEDLNLLLLLANQAVLAIDNAMLFEREKILLAEKSRRDALADMAPGVAHQFNNRLAAIIASADAQIALNEVNDLTKLDPKKLISLIKDSQDTLGRIEKEALRGKDIANAILKKGRAKLTYIKTDLAPIIQSAIDLLKVSRTTTSLEGASEPEIVLDVEKNLPQLVLNESLAQDIFYNLTDNARDAIIIKHRAIKENKITPEETLYKGKVTITAVKKDDRIVAVTVHDNGIGMDEKTKGRLFVPYFTTKATALKGTGMGLWVIRSFIEDHKGKISIESEYAKGTTFTITFPIGADIYGDSVEKKT